MGKVVDFGAKKAVVSVEDFLEYVNIRDRMLISVHKKIKLLSAFCAVFGMLGGSAIIGLYVLHFVGG